MPLIICWWCLMWFLQQKFWNKLWFLLYVIVCYYCCHLFSMQSNKRVLCIRHLRLLFGHKHMESTNDLNIVAVKPKPVKSAKYYSLMLDSTWNTSHTKQEALFKPTKKTTWKNKRQEVRRKQKYSAVKSLRKKKKKGKKTSWTLRELVVN